MVNVDATYSQVPRGLLALLIHPTVEAIQNARHHIPRYKVLHLWLPLAFFDFQKRGSCSQKDSESELLRYPQARSPSSYIKFQGGSISSAYVILKLG